MGYTVARPDGCTDWEFDEYKRLLRKQGVVLGRAPRVRDPLTDQRWLYFWEDRAGADKHVAALRRPKKDASWRVIEVPGPPSVGPLGPVVIQLIDSGRHFLLGTGALARHLSETAYPGALRVVDRVEIDRDTWQEYQSRRGGLTALVRDVGPALTGLTVPELEAIGYSVVDEQDYRTLAHGETKAASSA